MSEKAIRFLPLCLLLVMSLNACGPIYDTNYKFTPPTNPQGKRCTEQCPEIKEECLELEEIRKEDCDEINRRHVEDCTEKLAREKNRGPKWTECGNIRGCGISQEKCEEAYRSCYRSCGGQIQAEKVCIANCE